MDNPLQVFLSYLLAFPPSPPPFAFTSPCPPFYGQLLLQTHPFSDSVPGSKVW